MSQIKNNIRKSQEIIQDNLDHTFIFMEQTKRDRTDRC